MIANPQRRALAVGKTGCLFLVLLGIAEEAGAGPRDILATFDMAARRGLVGNDCFMRDPAGFMAILCGGTWTYRKAGPGHELPLDYKCQPGEFDIVRYQRTPGPGETEDDCAHFVRGDGRGTLTVGGDPMGASKTVAEGHVVSRRIVSRASP